MQLVQVHIEATLLPIIQAHVRLASEWMVDGVHIAESSGSKMIKGTTR